MKIENFKQSTDSMLCMLLGIFLMSTSTLATAKVNCNKKELAAAKKEFQILRNARKSDPGSVSDQEFRAISQHYINLSEECYKIKHGETEKHPIDNGGLWAPGSEQDNREEFNLRGTKWGAGSPFNGGQNVAGPQIPGGNVTWSLMANGVSSGAEALDNNTAIWSLATFNTCFINEIQMAFDAWASVANISFTQVSDNGLQYGDFGATGDIRIGAHSIDGQFGVLAHGYFPPPIGNSLAGDVHFDIAENWNCNSGTGVLDFGTTAIHEIGHAIGLRHQDPPPTALMNPFQSAAVSQLLADDIIGAQQIYGTTPLLISLILNFDWTAAGGGGTFFSTILDVFNDLTFTTPSGDRGQVQTFNSAGESALSFVFETGCAPLFSGNLIGFMKCTNGSQGPTELPGRYFLGLNTSSLSKIGDEKLSASPGTPIF